MSVEEWLILAKVGPWLYCASDGSIRHLLVQQPQTHGPDGGLHHVFCAQLFCDPERVELDGARGDAQLLGDQAIGMSGHYLGQYLRFASR
jgi:hypothetical protein